PADALRVARAQPHRDGLILTFDGVDDRDAAERLRGGVLEVPREEVPPAPEGVHYFFELIGCLCIDRTDGLLGRIEDVIEDGGGLLLRVERENRALHVPYVDAHVRAIDIDARRIEVELPAGLIETCAFKS
ncbi:MAG: ribosome maturation factor RimM, partial [Acidobacteriota bacterium]